MSTFKSQQAAHNWLKQGKVISEVCLYKTYYYKLIKGKLAVYNIDFNKWTYCMGDLDRWFDPEYHPYMAKSKLKDIPNYNNGSTKSIKNIELRFY